MRTTNQINDFVQRSHSGSEDDVVLQLWLWNRLWLRHVYVGLFWSICHAAMEDVIRCVALFYKAGTSGKDCIRKEKLRIRIPRGEDGKEIKLARLKDMVWYVDCFLFKY